jgi:predicted RNase H-like HicB family nuclease
VIHTKYFWSDVRRFQTSDASAFQFTPNDYLYNIKLTAIIEKSEDGWFVGQIEEIPAAISQGKTIEELKRNLLDALQLILETNRAETEVIREELVLVWGAKNWLNIWGTKDVSY